MKSEFLMDNRVMAIFVGFFFERYDYDYLIFSTTKSIV